MTITVIPSLSDILSLSSKYFSEFLHYLYPQYYTVKNSHTRVECSHHAFALLVAGSSGAKISCVSPVMIFFLESLFLVAAWRFSGDASKVTGVVLVVLSMNISN